MSETAPIKKYDGCSGGMSAIWRAATGHPPPWEGCCDLHDQPYAKGGTRAERAQADKELRECVIKNGHPGWAWFMWAMVRVGGVSWLPTPWRWGFDRKKNRKNKS